MIIGTVLVWVASYPRSGNTLTLLVLRDVFGFSRLGSVYAPRQLSLGSLSRSLPGRADFEPRPLPSELRELDGDELLDAPRGRPEPFFIKTHRLSDCADPAAAIYVVRDGRDSLVSFAHRVEARDVPSFRGRSFSDRLEMLLHTPQAEHGDWSQHVRAWTRREPPTAVVRYEQLLEKPAEAVGGILRRLGVEVGEPSGELRPFMELQEEDPKMYRRGRIGGWQDEMPAPIEERFWRLHGSEMEALGYTRSARLPERSGSLAESAAGEERHS